MSDAQKREVLRLCRQRFLRLQRANKAPDEPLPEQRRRCFNLSDLPHVRVAYRFPCASPACVCWLTTNVMRFSQW